jgi:uncharacterized protein
VTDPYRPGQRIAVVGTGISGLVSAHLLHPDHDITIFEANDYVGGHTNTLEVEMEGQVYHVDTGFIVFTEAAYPNFVKLLGRLGVASQPSDMSFSVRCESTGLEYNGTSLNKLFAQRSNLLRPSFYRMLKDIARFYKESRELLADDAGDVTLGEYLNQNLYSRVFIEKHIIPMGAAIWSSSPEQMLAFPARHFVRFFDHHGFLKLKDRPQWRTVRGGSQSYVKSLVRPFADRIRLNHPVVAIRRTEDGVDLTTSDGERHRFDSVVLACHSDQALPMLTDVSPAEKEVLGAIEYQENETVLHTDESILPRRRRAWASWNYFLPSKDTGLSTVTYNMNMLQSLDAPRTFCVTLNNEGMIDPDRVIRRITYHHPRFTADTIAAQARHGEINGVNRIFFCGAYWGFGFHEDGVRSALAALKGFGREI